MRFAFFPNITYIACLNNSIKSSFVTSLGLPGLQGSCIALSANIGKSSSFAPVSFTVCVIPTCSDKSLIFSINVLITYSFVKLSVCIPNPFKISLNL